MEKILDYCSLVHYIFSYLHNFIFQTVRCDHPGSEDALRPGEGANNAHTRGRGGGTQSLDPLCLSPSKVLLFFGNFVPLARRRDPVKEGQGCRWHWGKYSNRLWNSARSV